MLINDFFTMMMMMILFLWLDYILWNYFVQHSLTVLMEKMFAASPHFVRCIKPNGNKQADQVDSKLIMDQVSRMHFQVV